MKTKRLLTGLHTVLMICASPLLFAQDNAGGGGAVQYNNGAFGKGSNVLNLGIGLGGYYNYFGDGYNSTPNFVLSYDNGTFGNVGPGTISLGALFSYKGTSYNYTDFHTGYYYDQAWSYYILGIRSAYHWNFTTSSKFDPYIGLMLGYYDISYKETSNDPEFNIPGSPYYYYYSTAYNSYMAFSLYIGARYFLSNRVGLWLELGYGYTDAAFGVCFKL